MIHSTWLSNPHTILSNSKWCHSLFLSLPPSIWNFSKQSWAFPTCILSLFSTLPSSWLLALSPFLATSKVSFLMAFVAFYAFQWVLLRIFFIKNYYFKKKKSKKKGGNLPCILKDPIKKYLLSLSNHFFHPATTWTLTQRQTQQRSYIIISLKTRFVQSSKLVRSPMTGAHPTPANMEVQGIR